MKISIWSLNIILFFTAFTNSSAQNFLKTSGKKIVDGSGQEIILKGIGLGGWLLQEGYMLKTPYSIMGAEHEIKNQIELLIGSDRTTEFYQRYHENYVTETDIRLIAEWGFNSIRLPMHYDKLTLRDNPYNYIEEGFLTIDNLLSWCEKYGIYLILDLHGAPGGQSDEPISDYDSDYPSLWESEENKARTIDLWRKLAQRYADKEFIGGYDLINEPKWELGPGNAPLRQLYIDITSAIRESDQNHIVFIEGNWYATAFDGLTPPWDDNMVYSFHKYWNSNDDGAIGYLLALRNNYNTPLWLGETGENSNVWFTECVELMDKHGIGWAWWPHKKIDNISGPLSAPMVPQYQQLLNYWNGSVSKPSSDFAYTALMLQVDKLKVENCLYRPDVVAALISLPGNNSTTPFKTLTAPGRIYTTDYDIGKLNHAYRDIDYQNTGSSGGAGYNAGYQYRNDGVDIEQCLDSQTNGYNIGWTNTGEWLKFTMNVQTSGEYSLKIRYSANNSDGKIIFSMDDVNITSFIDLNSTNGWQNWITLDAGTVNLTAGIHFLKAQFFFGGFNLNFFDFELIATGVEDTKPVKADLILNQNYPNPFNYSTNISYLVPENSEIDLSIYDIKGELITTLFEGEANEGLHNLNWNSGKHSSGVYYAKLKNSSGLVRTIKILLLK